MPGTPGTGLATPGNSNVPVIGGLLLAPVALAVMLVLCPKLMVAGFAIPVVAVAYNGETVTAAEIAEA